MFFFYKKAKYFIKTTRVLPQAVTTPNHQTKYDSMCLIVKIAVGKISFDFGYEIYKLLSLFV